MLNIAAVLGFTRGSRRRGEGLKPLTKHRPKTRGKSNKGIEVLGREGGRRTSDNNILAKMQPLATTQDNYRVVSTHRTENRSESFTQDLGAGGT